MVLIWLYAMLSVVVVSLISIIGIIFLSVKEQRLQRMIFLLVSLAVGGLFGDAFIHLLPEAFADPQTHLATSVCILAGIFTFFILEKFLRWRHEHNVCEHEPCIHPVGYMNLIADGVHNLIDGMIIGASYLAGFHVGLTTTIAVILHEIPQEIGEFGILIHAGFSRGRALLLNFLSASLAIVGAVLALTVGARVEHFSLYMMPFTAGGFIYIAGSDLLPELHKESRPGRSLQQFAAIAAGVGLMLLLLLVE